MVKRGWFEEAPGMFSEFLGYVQRLLEDAGTRAVGALMLLSLLEVSLMNAWEGGRRGSLRGGEAGGASALSPSIQPRARTACTRGCACLTKCRADVGERVHRGRSFQAATGRWLG